MLHICMRGRGQSRVSAEGLHFSAFYLIRNGWGLRNKTKMAAREDENCLEPSLATRAKLSEKNDPSKAEEGLLLVSCLKKITASLEETISNGRDTFSDTGDVEKFISLDNPLGIRRLFTPMPVYAQAMSDMGLKSWNEMEQCLAKHYNNEDVCESTENLFSAQDEYKDFVSAVEEDLGKVEEDLGKVEEESSFKDILSVGDQVPNDLSLTLATVGEHEPVQLASFWKKTRVTLFILIRHFG